MVFGALAVGQALGLTTAWLLLPAEERLLGRPRARGLRPVALFGLWRGAQVALSPLLQTASRAVIVGTAGTVALGHLEAGRIIVAPILLAVQGFGSFLFATYASRSQAPLGELTRLATRAALALVTGVIGLAVLAILALPGLGPLVTGHEFVIEPLVVLGWACFAAGTAFLQPFASLAASRGQQRRVFSLRLIDAIAVPLILLLLLGGLSTSSVIAPFVMSGGLLLGGMLIQRFALGPLLREKSC